MRRIAAIVLAGMLLLALLPAARAAGADYTLAIQGGQTDACMETVNGEPLLRVDLFLNGISDDKLLTALSFDLSFDPALIGYITDSQARGQHYLYAVNASGAVVDYPEFILNDSEADHGRLRIVFASAYGCRVETGKPILSLYFWMMSELDSGTQIAFSIGSEIEAESVKRSAQNGSGSYVRRTVGTDLKPYTVSSPTGEGTPVNGIVAFHPDDVQYRGSTPYVVFGYRAHTPRLVVTNADTGDVIEPRCYTAVYSHNDAPGTATVTVEFRYRYSGTASGWFKIYLPETAHTAVENVDDGIRLTWDPVVGAAGYVIYRRAWNLIDDGWTTFERWNNTTETTWTDTKVYAGTRYQYGIKAYPVDPMDNYNLGMVGPLKTTVRITTRVLNAVSGSTGKFTAKWTGSKVFTGYEVQYATDAAFTKNVGTVKIADAKTYQTTVRNLKKGTYYVRVRSYHVFEGTTYYGKWSNTKSCKVK